MSGARKKLYDIQDTLERNEAPSGTAEANFSLVRGSAR